MLIRTQPRHFLYRKGALNHSVSHLSGHLTSVPSLGLSNLMSHLSGHLTSVPSLGASNLVSHLLGHLT